MRILFGLGLLTVSTALSGCVSNTLDNLSSLQVGCSTALTSVNCASPTVTSSNTPATGSTGSTGSSGGSTPPVVNTGNNAGLQVSKNDTTIAVESNKTITTVGNPAASKLITSPLLIGPTADQQIWFDTKTASNGNWPVSKTLAYNAYGTSQGSTAFLGVPPGTLNGYGGNYTLYTYGNDEKLQVWTWTDSYTTQYRDITASTSAPQHQAWSFGGNYTPAAQIPAKGGGAASTIYSGKFTATAVSSGWSDLPKPTNPNVTTATVGAKDLSYNNTWSVLGNAAITADWNNGLMTGTLSPKYWQARNTAQGLSTVDVDTAKADNLACYNITGACNPGTNPGGAAYHFANWQNYNGGFMDTDINLVKGIITTDTTSGATKTNSVAGTAEFDKNKGWNTKQGNNPMYAGFFGTGGPTEVAGVFSAEATVSDPMDGVIANNNERSAYMQMSGIFHAQ